MENGSNLIFDGTESCCIHSAAFSCEMFAFCCDDDCYWGRKRVCKRERRKKGPLSDSCRFRKTLAPSFLPDLGLSHTTNSLLTASPRPRVFRKQPLLEFGAVESTECELWTVCLAAVGGRGESACDECISLPVCRFSGGLFSHEYSSPIITLVHFCSPFSVHGAEEKQRQPWNVCEMQPECRHAFQEAVGWEINDFTEPEPQQGGKQEVNYRWKHEADCRSSSQLFNGELFPYLLHIYIHFYIYLYWLM